MNRQERRRQKAEDRRAPWAKFNLHKSFHEARAELGDEHFRVMMALLRQLVGQFPMDDELLFESIRGLTQKNVLSVYFRMIDDRIQVRPVFHISQDQIREIGGEYSDWKDSPNKILRQYYAWCEGRKQ